MDLQWTPGCNFARQDPIFILAAILWSQTLHESRLSKHLQRIYLLSSLFTQNDITIICSYFIFVSRLTNYVGNCLSWTKIRRVRTISPTDFTFPQSRHFVFYRVATILTKWTLFFMVHLVRWNIGHLCNSSSLTSSRLPTHMSTTVAISGGNNYVEYAWISITFYLMDFVKDIWYNFSKFMVL